MFLFPLLVDPLFFLFLNSLSRIHHLDMLSSLQAKGEGKEHPRTIGMGGTGKTKSSSSDARGDREHMLSSVFPYQLLLDTLFLPLPS
jgi:hypothetical protein